MWWKYWNVWFYNRQIIGNCAIFCAHVTVCAVLCVLIWPTTPLSICISSRLETRVKLSIFFRFPKWLPAKYSHTCAKSQHLSWPRIFAACLLNIYTNIKLSCCSWLASFEWQQHCVASGRTPHPFTLWASVCVRFVHVSVCACVCPCVDSG